MSEFHDMSRVDSFMASRRRAMFLHSVWKPMLAGAVGAAIMSAAVIGSVWVILPKISTREVVVDHVIQHDMPFDNHTPQDKPFDNYVPHDKPFDLPVPQASTPPKPVASAPPDIGPQSPYAAKTPEENKQDGNAAGEKMNGCMWGRARYWWGGVRRQAGVQKRGLSRPHHQEH